MNSITKAHEGAYRDRMMANIPGSRPEVSCPAGRIDLLTPTEIIELKRYECWRDGIGQLLSYWTYYPDRSMRLHVLLPVLSNPEVIDAEIRSVCDRVDIKVTWEYEDDISINVCTIDGATFKSPNALYHYIDELIYEAPGKDFEPHDMAFICDVINRAHWAKGTFGGLVDIVFIDVSQKYPWRNALVASAPSRNDYRKWKGIDIKNYVYAAFSHRSTKPETMMVDANDKALQNLTIDDQYDDWDEYDPESAFWIMGCEPDEPFQTMLRKRKYAINATKNVETIGQYWRRQRLERKGLKVSRKTA